MRVGRGEMATMQLPAWGSNPAMMPELMNPDLDEHMEAFSALVKLLLSTPADKIDFCHLSAENVNPQLLVGSLRATFAQRAAIPSWDHALDVAIDACALRGLNARKLLRGLL